MSFNKAKELAKHKEIGIKEETVRGQAQSNPERDTAAGTPLINRDNYADFGRRWMGITGTTVIGSFTSDGNSVSMSIKDFEQIIKFIPIEAFDCQLILKIPNTHVKQILIKHVGWERVLQKCGGTLVRELGEEYKLYQMNLGSFEFGRPIPVKILKVKDPSSGLFYCLRVPPNMEDCQKAKDWTFGEEEYEYAQEA